MNCLLEQTCFQINRAVELIPYSGRIQVLEDRSIRRDRGAGGYVRRVSLWEIPLFHQNRNKSNGLVSSRCSQIGGVGFGSQIQFWYFYEDSYQEPSSQFADCQLQRCPELHRAQRFQTSHCYGQALRSNLRQGLCGGSQHHQSPEPYPDHFPIESGGSDCCLRST